MTAYLRISLLGPPTLDRHPATVATPKGKKAWGLLAYLLLAERPPTRSHLAELLFEDAVDPLRALRWNLTELRKTLGPDVELGGDPVRLILPAHASVDTFTVRRGTWVEALELSGLGRDLLEGMDFGSSAAFEAWLSNERRHFRATSRAILHEAALSQLAAGDFSAAIDRAARLVEQDPLDERAHVLLVRGYVSAGRRDEAERQARTCEDLCRRELGVAPTRALRDALRANASRIAIPPLAGRPGIVALIDAGQAAIDAGATDAGIDCLRRAAGEAQESADDLLRAETLVAMGSALAHAGRGMTAEGSAALHRALCIAEQEGAERIAAIAERDLAWIEVLAGRYDRAETGLARATALAGDDPALQATLRVLEAWSLSEVSRYEASFAASREAIDLATSAAEPHTAALAWCMLARTHLLRHELAPGREALEAALDTAPVRGGPLVSTLRNGFLAEIEILEGRLDQAERMLQHGLAIALHVGDACLQAEIGRGLGLLAMKNRDASTAVRYLEAARMTPIRTPDHRWTAAWALDLLCALGVADRLPLAMKWVHDLESLAGRCGMREFVVRAYLHRHGLGDEHALAIAAKLAADIDNPFLEQLVAAGGTDLDATLIA